MPDIADAAAEQAPAAVVEPTPSPTVKDVSAELLASRLPPEQAKAFRAARAAKKDKEKRSGGDAETKTPPAKADPAPTTPEAEGEVIRFGEEEKPAEDITPAEEPALAELTEEELAKLTDKQRKAVTEASKEAAKTRKRAQEAEKLVAERDAKIAEAEKTVAELTAQMTDWQTRGVALAGNAFHAFKDAHSVAAWGSNAQEALILLDNHARAVKAGRATEEDAPLHVLPNGQEVPLTAAERKLYETRVAHAQAWFTHDDALVKNREVAKAIADKSSATKGYAEARDKYLKDPALHTRIEELVAKAAFVDVLNARKGIVSFSDTAGAAKSAPSSTAGGAPEKPAIRKPPSESPASTPRLVKSDDEASDIAARKSALMERARTSDDPATRQKLLKEAIMLGNPARIRGR